MNTLANTINLKKVIPIYECDELFLYEIIEDYKDANKQEEKDEIFHSFCSSLWSSDNKRRTYTKSIRFHIQADLLQTDLGQRFQTWTNVKYLHYSSMTKEESWRAMIRQKINNIYTRYFDKEVILGKEYIELLKTPKRLYYEWISGVDMDDNTVAETIENAMKKAQTVKSRLQTEKISLSWNSYKKVVESFLRKCFDNCRRIEDYEDVSKITTRLDFFTEDHFYVGYICKTLENYFRNYQKDFYGVRRGHGNKYFRCKQCGKIVEIRNRHDHSSKYCDACKRLKRKEANHNYYIKKKQKQ